MGLFFNNIVLWLQSISRLVPTSFVVTISFMFAFLVAKAVAKSLLSWGQ